LTAFLDLQGLGLVIEATCYARKHKLRHAALLLRQAIKKEKTAGRLLACSGITRINLGAAMLQLVQIFKGQSAIVANYGA
jgi:hypothetical protein